jgi:hypothetical protein
MNRVSNKTTAQNKASHKTTVQKNTSINTGSWTEVSGIAYIIINTFGERKQYSTAIARKDEAGKYAKEYVRIIPCQGCAFPAEQGEHRIIGNLSFRDFSNKNGEEVRELCIYAREIIPIEDVTDDIPF